MDSEGTGDPPTDLERGMDTIAVTKSSAKKVFIAAVIPLLLSTLNPFSFVIKDGENPNRL